MPKVKIPYLRYGIIDQCLRNLFPSKEELRSQCEERLYGTSFGDNICDSSIEKDIFELKLQYDAPIKYSKPNKGYYYYEDFILDLNSDGKLKNCLSEILDIIEIYPSHELEIRIKSKINKLSRA